MAKPMNATERLQFIRDNFDDYTIEIYCDGGSGVWYQVTHISDLPNKVEVYGINPESGSEYRFDAKDILDVELT